MDKGISCKRGPFAFKKAVSAYILFNVLLSFTKLNRGRFFFHATEARQLEDDYGVHDSDTDETINNTGNHSLEQAAVQEDSTITQEEGSHNEWFEVSEAKGDTQDAGVIRDAPEEETIDNDSDNLDIQDGDAEPSDIEELDNKFVANNSFLQPMVIWSFFVATQPVCLLLNVSRNRILRSKYNARC